MRYPAIAFLGLAAARRYPLLTTMVKPKICRKSASDSVIQSCLQTSILSQNSRNQCPNVINSVAYPYQQQSHKSELQRESSYRFSAALSQNP